MHTDQNCLFKVLFIVYLSAPYGALYLTPPGDIQSIPNPNPCIAPQCNFHLRWRFYLLFFDHKSHSSLSLPLTKHTGQSVSRVLLSFILSPALSPLNAFCNWLYLKGGGKKGKISIETFLPLELNLLMLVSLEM